MPRKSGSRNKSEQGVESNTKCLAGSSSIENQGITSNGFSYPDLNGTHGLVSGKSQLLVGDPFSVATQRLHAFSAPHPPVIYWPHTLRHPTSVDEEIEQATACIRDCLRTFSVRTGRLPPSTYPKDPPHQIDTLIAERDALQRVQAESEVDRQNLTLHIAALQEEKYLLEKLLTDATNFASTDFRIEEFQNQQNYFEQETRNLKRVISELRSTLNFQVEATGDAQRNAQLYRDQLESSDRDRKNLQIKIADLEKINRELAETNSPVPENSTTEPIEPEISSMTDATGEFQAARTAIKTGRKSRRKPKN